MPLLEDQVVLVHERVLVSSANTTTSGRTGVADALARMFGKAGAPADVFCSISASWPCAEPTLVMAFEIVELMMRP